MHHLLVVSILFCINLLHSQTILPSISDTTLTLSNSPYIVNNWITFSGDITIENGVKIILIGQYFITLVGSLNCGCSDPSILNNNTKGLSNHSSYIHFIGNESAPMSWGIFINQALNTNPTVQFCNTLFENVQNSIVSTSNQYSPYSVYNCEFKNVHNAIKHSNSITNTIGNSYFHDMNSIYEVKNLLFTGGVIFDHCLFHSFGKFSYDTAKSVNIAIRNSEIYGDGVQVCLNIDSITGDSKYAIYNNIISNCKDGIEILSADISVRNNTITNCSRYGIYAYNTLGEFDIKYNLFGNNGLYDIVVNNIQNVEIMDNIFMPNDINNGSIYAMDIDYININNNNFMTLKHNNILLFEYVDNIHIKYNNFINNYGNIISFNSTENITINHNNFIGNNGKYLYQITNGYNLYIHNNNFTNNTITNDLLHINNLHNIQINYNSFSNNELHQIISVQNTNQIYIQSNTFNHNYIDSHLILSNLNHNIYIQSNTFTHNRIQSNLIYFTNTSITNIKHNTFNNAINTNSILYFHYMDDTHKAYITHNNFIQSSNITSYINCNAGSVYFKPKIFIHFNNFHSTSHIQYFISTNDVYINGNNNYYASFKTYSNIKSYLNPHIICQINITSIIEQPISIHSNVITNYSKCHWEFMNSNCNSGAIINSYCESDTPSPTLSTIIPTYNPSIAPTIKPTIKPISPTIIPSISPTIAPSKGIFIKITPNPTTLNPTIMDSKEQITNTFEHENTTNINDDIPQILEENNDSSFMIMAGSAGITLVFIIFSGILLYVFLKLTKLKKETAHLNKQIGKHDISSGNELNSHGHHNGHVHDDDDLDAVINAMSINLNLNDGYEMHGNGNSRKSSKLSIMSGDIRKKSSLLTIASLQNRNIRKKSTLKSLKSEHESNTPKPPPRKSHTYQPRNIKPMAMDEEKDAIETDRDNSSAMYMNYAHNIVEIEGNETRGHGHGLYNNRLGSLDSADYNDNMVMNAINTSMPNIGELSVTAKHSFSKTLVKTPGLYNQKSNSHLNKLLKIDIPIVDELNHDVELGIKVNKNNDDELDDTQLSELLSEEETSESSRSFTIKSENEQSQEHKMNVTLEIADNKNINNGYIGLTSPTDTTMNVATPPTPQGQQSPIMDPDEILNSLEFRHKIIKQQQNQPGTGTPHKSVKLPKPKTKGHWM